jgi:hypothetical protein
MVGHPINSYLSSDNHNFFFEKCYEIVIARNKIGRKPSNRNPKILNPKTLNPKNPKTTKTVNISTPLTLKTLKKNLKP